MLLSEMCDDAGCTASRRVPLDRPLTYHKRIYEAIQGRNSDEARRQMLEHITDTKVLLTGPEK